MIISPNYMFKLICGFEQILQELFWKLSICAYSLPNWYVLLCMVIIYHMTREMKNDDAKQIDELIPRNRKKKKKKRKQLTIAFLNFDPYFGEKDFQLLLWDDSESKKSFQRIFFEYPIWIEKSCVAGILLGSKMFECGQIQVEKRNDEKLVHGTENKITNQ